VLRTRHPLVQRYPQHTFAVGGLDKNESKPATGTDKARRPASRIELSLTETNFDDIGTHLAV
jgi:hypothetical protein